LVNFRPNLLLVDHMPGGAQGELLPAVTALKQAHPNCCIVLGLRDILDAPEVTQRVWESDGAYDVLRHYYDRILIYGNKELFATCSTYCLPEPKEGTHYCGYVVKQNGISSLKCVRERLRIPKRRFVFVSAGGGGDGQLLMETYVRALQILGPRADFATFMAVGVNAPPQFANRLAAESRGLPIRIVPYVDDSASCIAAADLVVCMAGYNTLSEVLYFKTKALVVPRGGPSAEQRTRARLFAQRHLIDMLDPSDLAPEKLAERLTQDLERSDYPHNCGTFQMDGAAQAAARLSELLQVKAYAASV
jgi:predicted glycosyltransferase